MCMTTRAVSETQAEENQPEFDVFARRCPSRQTMEAVTGRWGVLVIAGLHAGSMRFSELRRRVDGVSEKMLSQTLHTLERDGLVNRVAPAGFPSRVDYSLTPLGSRVAAELVDLIELLEGSMPDIMAARERYDRERA